MARRVVFCERSSSGGIRFVAISLGDLAMLWIVLFVATCAVLGLGFVQDLST
jgi:hypothetical protein